MNCKPYFFRCSVSATRVRPAYPLSKLPDILHHCSAWPSIHCAVWQTNIHYGDVITSVVASEITSISVVCSAVCSGADQRKHQSSASLAFVRGIHRWPVNSPHKNPRKVFIIDLTLGFSGLGTDNSKTRRESFKFWHLVRLILETLRYPNEIIPVPFLV